MFRVVFISLSLFLSPAYAASELFVLPVGQGNGVIVRHSPEDGSSPNSAIIVDLGSKALGFSAFYTSRSRREEKTFILGSVEKKAETEALRRAVFRNESDKDEREGAGGGGGGGGDSGIRARKESSGDSDGDASTQSEDSTKTAAQAKRGVTDYKQHLCALIEKRLPVEGETFTVKTLLITHGDEDHYNLCPVFFSEERKFLIQNVVLGGVRGDYSETFQDWLSRAKTGGSINTIIYSGEEERDQYIRAYCSALVDKTAHEQRIESALKFEGGDVLRFQILAMNAGHSTDVWTIPSTGEKKQIVRRANDDKNTSSIVLRVSTSQQSVLLTGDAEQSTWDFIRASLVLYPNPEEDLRVSYFLLSHHGSKENGAVPKDLLGNTFCPQGILISAGSHKKFGHPRRKTLLDSLSLTTVSATQPHTITYFHEQDLDGKTRIIHRRRVVGKAVFSTVNNGMLSVKLSSEDRVITVSQVRETVCEEREPSLGEEKQQTGLRKFVVDHDQVYRFDSQEKMEEALEKMRQSSRVTLWKYTSKKGESKKKVHLMETKAAQNPREEEVNYIINEEKFRLYPLKELEEDEGEAAVEGENNGGGGRK